MATPNLRRQVLFSFFICFKYDFAKGIQQTARVTYKQWFQFFKFISNCLVNIFKEDEIINQNFPEVLITSPLKKEVSSSTSTKSQNLHIRSSFFLNHFPVTIAILKEYSLSFDKVFAISIFPRSKYHFFSCLSFRHVKNHINVL